MKKQIAILATIVAASGFNAFGQGYFQFNAGTKDVYDEFTTPGVGVLSADMTVALLWAASGTSDSLTAVAGSGGPSGNTSAYGLRSGTAGVQVATNGVTSVASVNPITTIQNMLGAGWTMAVNASSGTTGFGSIVTAPTAATGLFTYTGGLSGGNDFQIQGTTAGGTYEFIAIAWNASAASYNLASAIGWSNPITVVTGANSTDPNGQLALSAIGENQFGVAPVPEPATLALAGLGGLSMLFLRRRKA